MATPVIRNFSLTGAGGSFTVEVRSAGGARPAVVIVDSGRSTLVERLARAGFIVVATVSGAGDSAVILEELAGGGLSHRPTGIGVFGGATPVSAKAPWLAATEPLDEAGIVDWFAQRLT